MKRSPLWGKSSLDQKEVRSTVHSDFYFFALQGIRGVWWLITFQFWDSKILPELFQMSFFYLLLLDEPFISSVLQCQITANLSFLFQHLGFEQCLDLVFYFVSLVLFVLQKAEKYGIMKQSDLHRIPSFIKQHCI